MKRAIELQRWIATGVACVILSSAVAPASEAAPKLTCSFIAKQCRKECRKEVSDEFCAIYCSDKRLECLATGEWNGLTRSFSGVRRK